MGEFFAVLPSRSIRRTGLRIRQNFGGNWLRPKTRADAHKAKELTLRQAVRRSDGLGYGLLVTLAVWLMAGVAASAADQNPVRLACNEFPPQKMEAAPDGKRGFDVDILEQSFARVGRRLRVDYFPWKRALEFGRAGKLDGLCSCSRRADRDAWFIYSEPMGNVGVGVFLGKATHRRRVKSMADLSGLVIGVVRAYNLQQEMIDAGLEPVVVSDDEKGLRMLVAGRVDGFLTFRDTGRYILSKIQPVAEYDYVEFRSSPYFACFSKAVPNAAEITEAFNEGLRRIRADGTFDRIMAGYRERRK